MEALLSFLDEGEFEALRSIFPESLVFHGLADGAIRVQLLCARATASLLIPAGYPDAPPAVELEGLRRAEAAAALQAAAALGASLAGSPMLYELIVLLREQLGGDAAEAAAAEELPSAAAPPPPPPPPPPPLGLRLLSGPFETERKSVFQAHVAPVASADEVRACLRHVLLLPRVARATHPLMFAYRIHLPSGVVLADNDDDGEAGAGAKLAQLLLNMGCTKTLVVVSRWYGGVPLGPSRFAIISNCARKALLDADLAAKDKAKR